MSSALYIVTCVTTLLCAALLLRGWTRVRRPLLLWSGLCFVALTVGNVFVFLDLVLLRDVDLFTFRLGATAVAMVLLMFGLIWESQ